jgi:protein involved in polysaccharide export with SLBB domain
MLFRFICLPRSVASRHLSQPHAVIAARASRWAQALPGCFALLLLLGLASCETTVSTQLPADTSRTVVVLAPGDVVKVAFPNQPDYTQSQKIQSDGTINLPIIGQVHASGKTIPGLQATLTELYRPQLQNVEVVVSLDSKVIPVVVAGAVQKPAKYVFDRPTTVFQAIMEAGGPDQFGTLRRVKVTRLIGNQQQTEVLNLQPLLEGHPMQPRYVQAGDVIVVGESAF